MENKFTVSLIIIASMLLVNGCSDGKFIEEAKQTKEQNQKAQVNKEKEEKERVAREKELYESMEKPIDEVIQENDLDKVELNSDNNIKEMSTYEDANEFSKYAAKILYDFYTSQIDPKGYYDFIKNYASKETIAELPSEADAINLYSTLQNMYKQKNITGDGYIITNVIYDSNQRGGYFYRKLTTTNGVEYFITTITKEGDGWKFVEDSPSPPFEETIENN
ncbi:hypothetical protein NSQ82_20295 [Caldifermentibacillus hisashii]|uniref:hypothetical protein n=1 Tax=Caldifermentibacillus hisashii TaxID=996558 RepID=UPI0031B725FD